MYYRDIFLDEAEEINENLRVTGVMVEIRTEYLPDMSVECYRHTNVLGPTR